MTVFKIKKSRIHWRKQKALAVLHFRRQVEEEVSLLVDNAPHTYVYELITQGGDIVISEDGTIAFYL
jgi:hypothetical protein